LGIIVFSVVITTSFGQVLLTSIKQLTSDDGPDRQIHLDGLGLGILVGNIAIKAGLWLWCSRVKGSSSVQVLAQDHRNDVLFNGASAIFPIVGKGGKSGWGHEQPGLTVL
jgi:divalent metal cation (Fe/Co/Zn/Cd) transporter